MGRWEGEDHGGKIGRRLGWKDRKGEDRGIFIRCGEARREKIGRRRGRGERDGARREGEVRLG